MILTRVKLTNFRNLSGDFSPSKHQNILIADNGAGKTNFLESLVFLSQGKSFRTSDETHVINKSVYDRDISFTRIVGELADPLGKNSLREVIIEKMDESQRQRVRKTLKVESVKKRLSDFNRQFHSVIFSPNTINLVISSPSVRRRDLDDFIVSIYDGFFDVLCEYRKVVRNRNKLLERIDSEKKFDQLGFWNNKLIEVGSVIIHQRMKAIKEINPIVEKLTPLTFNANVTSISLNYESKFTPTEELADIKQIFRKKIEENQHKEMRAGLSLYGPHREDFSFLFNGDNLKNFGSRGQQRLASFCYKIAQGKILQTKNASKPVLLLDDLFSELDATVRNKVCKYLLEYDGQIFLTALDRDDLPEKFLKAANFISLD